jgi:uncharacterized membrane protein YesL
MSNVMFAPLFGIDQASGNPTISSVLDLSSVQMGLPVFSPVVNITIICLVVIMAITWGWQNIGATYVLRGLVRGDAVFVFSDFFYGIKKNLKQGFFLGLIDFFFCAIIGFNYSSLLSQTGTSFGVNVMFFMTLALMIIYFIMRFYVYLLLVTFDLKNTKIIKNALIFTILGIKRNLLAFLGIILLVGIHIGLILMLVPAGISLPLIIPVVYIMAATAFMSAYAAYPVIDKYMIEPYVDKSEQDDEFVYFGNDDESNTEPVSDAE